MPKRSQLTKPVPLKTVEQRLTAVEKQVTETLTLLNRIVALIEKGILNADF